LRPRITSRVGLILKRCNRLTERFGLQALEDQLTDARLAWNKLEIERPEVCDLKRYRASKTSMDGGCGEVHRGKRQIFGR
jgi:hypothetical protein